MIDRDPPVTEDELHAYVDSELPAERRAAVETWLATHPDDMARVGAWRAQADAIRSALWRGRAASRFRRASTSTGWHATCGRGRASRRPPRCRVFARRFGAGWFGRDVIGGSAAEERSPFQAFTAEAVDAYNLYVVEVRHPVEVPAADADHLVQWLSKRVGYPLRAPDLGEAWAEARRGPPVAGPTASGGVLHVRGTVRRALHDLLCALERPRHSAALQRHRQSHGGLLGQQRSCLCGERQR